MNKQTITIEVKITHVDCMGNVRESRRSRVVPTSGDNPNFIESDVDQAYDDFHNTQISLMIGHIGSMK